MGRCPLLLGTPFSCHAYIIPNWTTCANFKHIEHSLNSLLAIARTHEPHLVGVFFDILKKNRGNNHKSGVCSEPCSSLIRHLCLFTMHLWKMLDFSVLLPKVLYPFVLVVFWLNYDLHVVFYVGFRNFRKNPILKINWLKIKRPLP